MMNNVGKWGERFNRLKDQDILEPITATDEKTNLEEIEEIRQRWPQNCTFGTQDLEESVLQAHLDITTILKEVDCLKAELKNKSTDIKTSKDYDKFKLTTSAGNRPINENHVKAIIRSYKEKNLAQYFPILVNSEYEIFDGQHRFLALKELGLEVPYMVAEDLQIRYLLLINQNQKNWKLNDFINNQADQGDEDCIRLRDDNKSLGVDFGTLYRMANKKRLVMEDIEKYKIRYSEAHSKSIHPIIEEIEIFSGKDFFKNGNFISAYMAVRDVMGFDYPILKRQYQKRPDALQKGIGEQYFKNLIAIYNHNLSRKNQLSYTNNYFELWSRGEIR